MTLTPRVISRYLSNQHELFACMFLAYERMRGLFICRVLPIQRNVYEFIIVSIWSTYDRLFEFICPFANRTTAPL